MVDRNIHFLYNIQMKEILLVINHPIFAIFLGTILSGIILMIIDSYKENQKVFHDVVRKHAHNWYGGIVITTETSDNDKRNIVNATYKRLSPIKKFLEESSCRNGGRAKKVITAINSIMLNLDNLTNTSGHVIPGNESKVEELLSCKNKEIKKIAKMLGIKKQ